MGSDSQPPESNPTLDITAERWAEIDCLLDDAPPPHDESFRLADGTPITRDEYCKLIEERRAARTT